MIQQAFAGLRRRLAALLTADEASMRLRLRITPQLAPDVLEAAREKGLYLDRRAITAELASHSGMMGAIAPTAAGRCSIILARRMAERFARRYAMRMRLELNLVAEALCFEFWSQLCVLIPMRHLARTIARRAGDALLFVELPRLEVACLESWNPNQLEPLFLYAELVRCGANVLLCCPQLATSGAAPPTLRFRVASGPWDPQPGEGASTCDRKSTKAIVASAIRGVDRILESHGPMHAIACAHAGPIAFCESLMQAAPQLPEIAIALTRARAQPRFRRLTVYEGTADSLDACIFTLLHKGLIHAAQSAERIVATRRIDEVHCCDHYFVESVLMGHAVRKAGGRVILWPHSANPNHYHIRTAGEADEIHCITQTGKRIWNQQLPGAPVVVNPELMIHAPPSGMYPATAGAPLSVIIIGGAEFLGRLPVLHLDRHARLVQQLFARLRDHAGTMDVIFRPKPLFEDEAWLNDGLGIRDGYKIAQREPMAIEVPNPVFVMISLASTALLEGIGRGIPSFIVRDFPVEDYIRIDEGFFPVGLADFIVQELARCTDPAYRARVLLRQAQWYRHEIEPANA